MQLCEKTFEELARWFKERGCEPWRATQVWSAIYKRGASNVATIHNAGPSALKAMKQLEFPTLHFQHAQPSQDEQTIKVLWRLNDAALVESVLIKAPNRNTICVSSQVGCPARCAFCASGKEGLVRNLSTAEIVEQVLHMQNLLREETAQLTHIVFMGMGEPLCNCDAVLKAIAILTDPRGLAFSPRKICISTVGVLPGMQRLIDADVRVNLVLSLHAPNQRLRQKLLPFARKYPLDELLRACDAYFAKTGREVNFEYILIDQFNDQLEHAEELVDLLRTWQTTVNLIPYNPIDGITLKRPSSRSIERFQAHLLANGVRVTRRYTKGDDIAAACGQLALRKSAPSLA